MMDVRVETLTKLNLQSGDILHVRVGGDLGDGMGSYIPTSDEVDAIYVSYADIVPDGVQVIVTHYLVDNSVISNINCTSWPPKTP